jgi:putative oxidoreductase
MSWLPFVAVVEIVCGSLLLIDLATRLATVPLLIDIAVALYSTKIVTFAKKGFWGTLHEPRTDVSMLLGLIFLPQQLAAFFGDSEPFLSSSNPA